MEELAFWIGIGMLVFAASGLYSTLCYWVVTAFIHRHVRYQGWADLGWAVTIWLVVTGLILVFGSAAIHGIFMR